MHAIIHQTTRKASMDSKFRSRKFILAASGLAVSSIALLLGMMDGSAYVLALGTVLGMYGAANVSQRAVDRERD